MKNKILVVVLLSALFQLVSITKSSAQLQAINLGDMNFREEFAVIYLKMKNEFQITDAKIQLPTSQRNTLDTLERRLRTMENQADILGYMNVQGWILHQSQFALNNSNQQYPFAYLMHIYKRLKK